MPDTVFDEDTLAAASEAMGEEEERPLTFAELGVPGPLVRVLAADDKKTAFPIQADTLPDSLAGRDILGRGRTGSGKTLAFSIPLVARLGEVDAGEYENMSQFRHEVNRVKQAHAEERRADDFVPHPRGLVLAPTRELANQINDVLMPLAQIYGINTTTVYGGVRYARQIRDLQAGADIVVACPGRLEDLIEQGALTLDKVEVAVIDEADEMADMGFLPPVKRLLGQISFDAQIMLFSATLDHGVDEVVETFLSDPKVHSVDSATATVDEMTHHVFKTTQGNRHELVRTLASGKGRRILFTRTKFQTQKLAKDLTQNGIPAAELHGNLSQNQRDRNLAAFNSGDVNVMVATDVAARGIDVSGVELVVQVEPPEDPKSFLHRSGRTARAGHSGDVVTIILPNQRRRTGLAMTTFGVGFGNFFGGSLIKLVNSDVPSIALSATSSYFSKSLPFAVKLGWFGKLFLSYGFLAYLAVIIAFAASYILSHTRTGLHLRAVGEGPNTADAAGINVSRYKYIATCVGCMIAGLGGLYYVMDYACGVWSNDAFGDRGWLAIALVIFTIWRPNISVFASFLFGGLYILYLYLPTGIEHMEYQELYKMIPYVVTLLVLVITSMRSKRENQPPASLGLAYFREER